MRESNDHKGLPGFLNNIKLPGRTEMKKRLRLNKTRLLVGMGKKVIRKLDDNSRQAVILQYRTLLDLVKENADTEYGRAHDFTNIHSLDDYRERVPFTTYDDYAPFITRMMAGEEYVLTRRPPVHYALTSGSIGVPRYIPVSREEIIKLTAYAGKMAFGVADEYYRNTTGRAVPTGPGMCAIEWQVARTEKGVDRSAISAALLKTMKDYVPLLLTSPWEIICPEGEMDMKYLKTRLALGYRDLAFMESAFMTGLVDLMDYIRDNYEMLCRDIYHGRINKDVKVPEKLRRSLEENLKPDQQRAKELLREFREGFDTPIIPRIWPRMSWIGGIGTGGFFPYARKMRKYSGKSIPFNNLCYAASESCMAVARHMGDESFVLIPDGGFYEFIPVREQDETKTLTIEELEVGEDYEIVVTNLSGFYRYRLQDVVRVTGYYNETPMLRFLYRRDQLVSLAGEKTNEETLRWAIDEFSRECGLYVTDYSVFADTETHPGHYVLLIEPERIISDQEIPRCRDVLEGKLMQANPAYGEHVRKGDIGPMELVFLQQQTYQLYRDLLGWRGYNANQIKPVRVIDTPQKEKFFFRLREK